MGLQSWKKEFYPISAEKAAESADARTVIAHSLVKWQGLLPENLQKHNVIYDSEEGGLRSARVRDLARATFLPINDESCSLCAKYQRYIVNYATVHQCGTCPLYKVRSRTPCYSPMRGEKQSPFNAFTGSWNGPHDDPHDPRPMIQWLKKALAMEKKRQATKPKKAKQARQRRLLKRIG